MCTWIAWTANFVKHWLLIHACFSNGFVTFVCFVTMVITHCLHDDVVWAPYFHTACFLILFFFLTVFAILGSLQLHIFVSAYSHVHAHTHRIMIFIEHNSVPWAIYEKSIPYSIFSFWIRLCDVAPQILGFLLLLSI